MRIFLSDTFYEAVLALPRRAQRKVIDFQRKLRENSTSNGIHIEPIAAFRDDSLRTARVDDNYRAIIGVLDKDSYYLVYVGTHEQAYKWGERKKIIWNDITDTIQLITVEETTETVPVEKAEEKLAWKYNGVPAEKLLKIGVPEELIPKVCKIETLNGLDKMEEYLPTDAYENLFNLMDGADIDEIIAEIEEGKAKENQDKQLSDNNKRRFVELTDDDELQRIIDQDMEAWQLFLHPSQRKLVDTDYKGTMKVSGGAGTGKTVAAMHRLKYLCGNKDSKVLFTTYTKTLKENLGSLLKKMDINIRRYTLNNIDQVLLDVARNYFIKERYKILDYSGDEESLKLWREVLETEVTEFDEKFLYDEYIDVIVYYGISDSRQYLMQARVGRTKALSRKQRMEVWRLVEKYVKLKEDRKVVDRLELFNEVTKYLNENNVRPYTNVIADEFQDFSNPELKFLRALVAEGENDLFLTGDPMQRIYSGRKINFRAAGINVRGVRSKRLKVNYRTTEPIKRVAVSVVKGQKYDDMDGGSESMKGYISLIRGGEAPVYTMVNNVTEEVEQVIEWINGCKESEIPLKDICVATPVSNQARELKSRLHHENIPFKEIKGYSPVGSRDGISLCTFHSLKGLEFRVIILMGVNERNIPSKETNGYPFFTMDALEKKEYLSSRRSLLYVAITRARALVYMVGYGEACGLMLPLVAKEKIRKKK